MASMERFEDVIAWQKARVLTREIYRATRSGPFAQDRGLCMQIQRAAVSVMSNIAEGFERTGKGDFPHFLSIAKASCAEVRCQLSVALDVGYLAESEFGRLLALAEEVSRVISGLRTSITQHRNGVPKAR